MNQKEEFWRKIIDGTKTAFQIAKEEKVNETTVYNAAKRYGLYLPRQKDLVDNYHGIPLEVLKKELKTMPVSSVAKKYGLTHCGLRQFALCRGIETIRVQRQRQEFDKDKADNPNIKIRRTGEAMDMIKTLLPFYTDASIARVFGYSKERIRQIRNETKE